jgi:hypothetical protein
VNGAAVSVAGEMRSLVFRHSRVEPERQRFGWSAQREPMLAGMIFPHLMHVLNICRAG